ncbi:MAG: alpha-glucosidase C-terminal domain-containing protein [Deltaproteobacteria bacterium]|nr:alpha-glucosidase C-terminal domain-containing protein [Candidatus Zymogenaceae bacterium]
MKRKGASDTRDWWKDGIVYQIYPRSFMDANGDGIGDLSGVISRLDYLNDGTPGSLGVDAIWFSPFYPSPMFDFGYDISDYKSIDPAYGTMADFDRLLVQAHKRGIKVILDFVPNHTSHLHPWFVESRNSRTNPKRDWYIWSAPSRPLKRRYTDGAEPPRRYRPNNWQSIFGGPAWTWDEKTQEYYYHHFLVEQPDVNWRNPELREAMYDQMRFWLDKGVDGFRLDVINFIFKDKLLRSNPYCIGRRPYDMQRHLYDKDLPENIEVVREMRRLVNSYGDRMLVGEIANDDPNEPARYYGNGTDGLNLSFYFHFANQPFCADSFGSAVAAWETAVPKAAWPVYFLSNHDRMRHIGRYHARNEARTLGRAQVAAMLLLTVRGTPFLYYGEEIGMANLSIKKKDLQDPVGIRYWPIPVGRDPERTPMQWDNSTSAGFSSAAGTWLPVNPDYKAVNVAAQADDPSSLFSFYRKIIWKRKESAALTRGTIEILRETPRGILAYLREYGDDRCLIVLSFSHEAVDFTPKDDGGPIGGRNRWRVLVSNRRDEADRLLSVTWNIKPLEATVFSYKK